MSSEPAVVAPHGGEATGFDIAPNDPIVPFFLSTSGAMEVDGNTNSDAWYTLGEWTLPS